MNIEFRPEVLPSQDIELVCHGIEGGASISENSLGLDLEGVRKVFVVGDAEYPGFVEQTSQSSNWMQESAVTKFQTDSLAVIGIAKTLPVVLDQELQVIVVLSHSAVQGFVLSKDTQSFDKSLQTIVHEFAHAHDYKTQFDLFKRAWELRPLSGLNIMLWPIVANAWSEYWACRTSANIYPKAGAEYVVWLKHALQELPSEINKAKLDYRAHRNVDQLALDTSRVVDRLMAASAYYLGHFDAVAGLEKRSHFDAKLLGDVSTAVFDDVFFPTEEALRTLYDGYPSRWVWPEIYEPMFDVVHSAFFECGLLLSEAEEGELNLRILR